MLPLRHNSNHIEIIDKLNPKQQNGGHGIALRRLTTF